MPEDAQNPEVDQVQQPTESSLPEPTSDPLDALKANPDALLAEAKKLRAIAQRKATPKPEKQEPVQAAEPSGDFVSKTDLLRYNTKLAKDLVPAEIQANWLQVLECIPPQKSTPETPQEIAAAAKEGYLIWQSRQTEIAPKPDTTDLTSSPSIKAGGGPVEVQGRQTVSTRRKSQPMSDWYPKPQK